VIAASNKDLERQIAEQAFREDLYYRLNVFPIKVPPLRDRIEALPTLIELFLAEASRQNRRQRKKMTDDAMAVLARYPWPGNVRELKNLVERLDILVSKNIIDISDIPPVYNPEHEQNGATQKALFAADGLKEARRLFEKTFIERKLAENDHNVSRTAEQIGVERSYLHRKIKKLT
jgi:two-component system nitrogen regulation response regulator NtrX